MESKQLRRMTESLNSLRTMWVQLFSRELKPLSDTKHSIFMATFPIPPKGRKWQVLNSCPCNGFNNFQGEIEKQPTQVKLQWKKSVHKDVQGQILQESFNLLC